MPDDNQEPMEELSPEEVQSEEQEQPQNGTVDNAVQRLIKFVNFMRKIAPFLPAIIVVGIIIFIFIVVITTNGKSSSKYGKGGFSYYNPGNCTTVIVHSASDSRFNGTYEIEDYIAAVVAAEVGGFDSDTIYETFAVAARTFYLANQSDCSIAGNTTKQALNPDRVTDRIKEAVANTEGQVLTKNGTLISTQYDAFCWKEKDATSYTMTQANQVISLNWINSTVPSAYKDCNCSLYGKSSDSFCYDTNGNYYNGGHGNGMSQYGAYYLAKEMSYDYRAILAYFYGNDIEFNSIFYSGADFAGSASLGNCIPPTSISYGSEPDPSCPINYWLAHSGSYPFNKNTQLIYPQDERTGLPLGAWPADYSSIPIRISINKTYQGGNLIWPVTPSNEIYSFVYSHNGIDIMAPIGTPIYAPADGTLVYSEWGHTKNRGVAETAYTVSLRLDSTLSYSSKTIVSIFMTHMVGIVYRCSNETSCASLPNGGKVKKGDLIGFVGNAAGDGSGVGGWAPHLHMTFVSSKGYSDGLITSQIESLYGISAGQKIRAGE